MISGFIFDQEENKSNKLDDSLLSIQEFTDYFKSEEFQLSISFKELNEEDQEEYFTEARKFFKTCFQQLKQRLPWKDLHTKQASPLLLVQSLQLPKHIDPKTNVKNIYQLGERFKKVISGLDFDKFGAQLHTLENNYEEMRKRIKKKNTNEYLEAWNTENKAYSMIFLLAEAMQTLPFSSASIERLFSELGNIVTVKRNRLSIQNIEACIYIRQEYKGNTSYFTKEMIKKYYQAESNDFCQKYETEVIPSQPSQRSQPGLTAEEKTSKLEQTERGLLQRPPLSITPELKKSKLHEERSMSEEDLIASQVEDEELEIKTIKELPK